MNVVKDKEEQVEAPVVNLEETSKKIEENLTDSADVIRQFLNDPIEKKNAQALAKQIYDNISKSWFKADKLVKLAGLTPQDAVIKLEMLKCFGLCSKSKDKKNVPTWKITLTVRQQIFSKEAEIQKHEIILRNLKKELEVLRQVDEQSE